MLSKPIKYDNNIYGEATQAVGGNLKLLPMQAATQSQKLKGVLVCQLIGSA